MAFTDAQVRQLRRQPHRKDVKTREQDGREFPYLEGWHAIAEANRIFGFDAWSRQTVWTECVWRQQQGTSFAAAYLARVRISVASGSTEIVREGSGAGQAIEATPGQAHELAMKAAETDATKRALSTFGKAFGLSLYGSAAVHRAAPTQPAQHQEQETDSKPLPAKPSRVAPNGNGTAERPNGRIDKSQLLLPEPRRTRDRDHLRYVSRQPCLICGRTPSHAHHLKFVQPRAAGRKVSDEFTVPLCAGHHRELHGYGDERRWWNQRKLDPTESARALWLRTLGACKQKPANVADTAGEGNGRA